MNDSYYENHYKLDYTKYKDIIEKLSEYDSSELISDDAVERIMQPFSDTATINELADKNLTSKQRKWLLKVLENPRPELTDYQKLIVREVLTNNVYTVEQRKVINDIKLVYSRSK